MKHVEPAGVPCPERRASVEVAAGLVFRAGKLLIAQRLPESHLGGLWEFPGGKREPGETFEACLSRELREELGIEVTVGKMVERVTHCYPEKTVHLRFFHCAGARGEPQALGCADFRWIKRGEVRDYAFPPADARLLERLVLTEAWWGAEP